MATTVEAPARSRRHEAAIAVFATWMITGLFIDGWAHEADKPETFFSPWHGILYSGFVAAVLWFMWDGRRRPMTVEVGDRLATVGLVVFVAGALGDGAWHEIFGIEVDLEALLSPTHLLLLIGGFLMATYPIRAAWQDTTERAPGWREFAPQAVTLMLAAALVSFFTMYLSVFEFPIATFDVADEFINERIEVQDIASVLVTNLILMASLVFACQRWETPFGVFTLLFTGTALFVNGLQAFDFIELVVPALIAGVAADLLVRWVPLQVVAAVVPVILWSSYFAIVHATEGLVWTPELWVGAIVLSAASAVLLAALAPQLNEAERP